MAGCTFTVAGGVSCPLLETTPTATASLQPEFARASSSAGPLHLKALSEDQASYSSSRLSVLLAAGTCAFVGLRKSTRRAGKRHGRASLFAGKNASLAVMEEAGTVPAPTQLPQDLALDFQQRVEKSLMKVGKEHAPIKKYWNDKDWKYYDVSMIYVRGGDGGLGCKSFLRLKNEPFCGPNGGNGGHGGHVYLHCVRHRTTLVHLKSPVHYEAERGAHGEGGKTPGGRDGKNALSKYVEVPVGCLVYVRDSWLQGARKGGNTNKESLVTFQDLDKINFVYEFTKPGEILRVARGGRGGRGNRVWKTHRNTAPWIKEDGEKGRGRWIELVLKTVADIGIIGMPNAGKSSFLYNVTNAQPKIAPYAFTTVQPNLGNYNSEDHGGIALCDIPGIIAGASEGRGMGFQFLRHIERCRALIHIVAGNSENPVAEFELVQSELAKYDPRLLEKPQVVLVNKCDLPETAEHLPELMAALRERCGHTRVMEISCATQKNVDASMKRIYKWFKKVCPVQTENRSYSTRGVQEEGEDDTPCQNARMLARYGAGMPKTETKEGVELDPQLIPLGRARNGAFEPKIEWDVLEEAWRIKHPDVEQSARLTNWTTRDADERFNRILKATGVHEALSATGLQDGDPVIAGDHKFQYSPSAVGRDSRMLLYEMDMDY
eukprot:TRINITY_DN92502_c0_g1_i1.p1 TRINITY_DN92502_c0_g1~~TRINITY_DN92502_c0_g1_i1.p1  ORF type:complete len:706 (+),score=109.85 TRINITY_DN92502_c0_g1_i1:138-2120(+)